MTKLLFKAMLYVCEKNPSISKNRKQDQTNAEQLSKWGNTLIPTDIHTFSYSALYN